MSSDDVWAAFARGEAGARARLIAEHGALVQSIAQQLSTNLPANTQRDDLVSAGTIGLMNAIDNFDPARGVAFSTFATPRVRGAMQDEMRRLDHVPRSVRRKIRAIGGAREALMRALGRAPNDREIAAHLGIHVDTLWRWLADAEGSTMLTLERPSREHEERAMAGAPIADEGAADERVTREQEAELLRQVFLGMSEQERTVLSLYYYEQLKLHEIAAVLGLTESRISQIRSRALARMRGMLPPADDQPARPTTRRPRSEEPLRGDRGPDDGPPAA
jgi:RNA polymerase sigma factor for flagellar operon FliA